VSVVRYAPTDTARDWLVAEGFLEQGESWAWRYRHSSGWGVVLLRFWPHDYGWDAIVEPADPPGQAVSLGTCTTLASMQAVYALLRGFEYVPGRTPSEKLVRREVSGAG